MPYEFKPPNSRGRSLNRAEDAGTVPRGTSMDDDLRSSRDVDGVESKSDSSAASSTQKGSRRSASLENVAGNAPVDSEKGRDKGASKPRKKDPTAPKKAKKGPSAPAAGGVFAKGANGKIIVPEEETREQKLKKEELARASARSKEDLELKKAEKARLLADEKEREKAEIEANRLKAEEKAKVRIKNFLAVSSVGKACGMIREEYE